MLAAEGTPSLGDIEKEPPPDPEKEPPPEVITLEALEDPEQPLAPKHREQMWLLRQRMFVGATVGGFIFMLIVATPVLVVTLSDPSARSQVEHGTSTYDAGYARLVVQSATFSCQSVTAEPVAASEPVRSIMEKNGAYLDAFNPASDRWDAPPPPPVTVLQASPGVRDGSARAVEAGSGLVSTLLDAYAQHHELLLRPDDVWQAILTQLNFYVNGGRAERLRDVFVDFDGQRELRIETCCSTEALDYGALAREFTDLIAANVNDPTLVDWSVGPSFSTSTHTDRVVASVTLMSTLRAYFKYTISILCGFPKVTLLGTPADWALLRTKIDRLLEFELDEGLMARWHALLAPLLDEMARTAAGEPADADWWAGVAQEETVDAGCTTETYFDGWVIALVPFDARGQWNLGVCYHEGATVPLPAPECPGQQPRVERDSLPVAAVSVNVTIETESGASIFTSMIAGQFAQEVSANGVGLQPRSDWLIGYA